MATTVKKIIKKMMQKAGILTKTQEPAADEANDALDALNAMIASWSNDSMLIYGRTLESFPVNAGVGSYSIGPGQVFNTVRPIDIVSAYIRQGSIDHPVSVINDETYAAQIAYKLAPGLPQWLNFNNAYPSAIINLFPVPATGYSLFILSEKILTQFALNDTVDLPPGWERMLIYNGAIEIAGDYGQEVPDTVVAIARGSKLLVKKGITKNHSMDWGPRMPRANNVFSGYNQ